MLFSIFYIIALLIQALIASKKKLWMPVVYTILPTALLAILTWPLSPLRRYRSAWWCFRWGNKGKPFSARSELWGGWSMASPKESVKFWIRAEACVLALSCRSRTPFVNMPLEQCKTTSPWQRQNTHFCSDPGLLRLLWMGCNWSSPWQLWPCTEWFYLVPSSTVTPSSSIMTKRWKWPYQ